MRVLLAFLLVLTPAVALAGGKQSEIRKAVEAGRLTQAQSMLNRLPDKDRASAGARMLQADIHLAQKEYAQALALYILLCEEDPGEARCWSGSGIALLNLGKNKEAEEALRKATSFSHKDWRAWNAYGVVLDRRGDWPSAHAAYDRALQVAPNHPEILNNLGYSLLLQKRLPEAVMTLHKAAAAAPGDARIARNLELAQAMSGVSPVRKDGESAASWAARLNNAGYAAWLAGDLPRARSLLAQAIEASETHYERAEANLAMVEKQLNP